jgi:hypothetical protein
MTTKSSFLYSLRRDSLPGSLGLALCTVLWCTPIHAGTGGSKVAPASAHPYGQTLAEWLSSYATWLFTAATGPQQFGHVLYPIVAASVSGSGTVDDPLVVTGQGDFTVKAGTSFVTPLLFWASELYGDGSTDPLLPLSWWGSYLTLSDAFEIDGEAIVTEQNVNNFYISSQIYDPPVLYAQPTPYGSIGVHAVQGWAVVCKPLSVGVHKISWEASFLAPADNEVLPFELGQVLRLSYTITVIP